MNTNPNEKGVFINGRVKAFEILKRLEEKEKTGQRHDSCHHEGRAPQRDGRVLHQLAAAVPVLDRPHQDGHRAQAGEEQAYHARAVRIRQVSALLVEALQQLVDGEAEADHRQSGAHPCHQAAVGGHEGAAGCQAGAIGGQLVRRRCQACGLFRGAYGSWGRHGVVTDELKGQRRIPIRTPTR